MVSSDLPSVASSLIEYCLSGYVVVACASPDHNVQSCFETALAADLVPSCVLLSHMTGLQNGRMYLFRVRARNALGESMFCPCVWRFSQLSSIRVMHAACLCSRFDSCLYLASPACHACPMLSRSLVLLFAVPGAVDC